MTVTFSLAWTVSLIPLGGAVGRRDLNQRVCRIKSCGGELDDGYLSHFLPGALKRIEDATPFVTVKHLSVKDIRDIEIPLPPLAEQQRIAAILDQAEALRAKRRHALTQLDTLTQSLFLDLFGDPGKIRKGPRSAAFGCNNENHRRSAPKAELH